MVVVPTATAVTTPVLEIVAIEVLDDAHGVVASGVAEPVKVDVNPRHAFIVPVIVGSAYTVKVPVVIQPLLFI